AHRDAEVWRRGNSVVLRGRRAVSGAVRIGRNEMIRLAASTICIWLSVWAIRKRSGIDETLDRTAQFVRWLIVAACAVLISLRGARLGYVRVGALILGWGFLCW